MKAFGRFAFAATIIALSPLPTRAQVPDNPYFNANFTPEVLWRQMNKGNPSIGIGATGIGSTSASGNEFYSPTEYEFDCNTNPLGPDNSVLTFSGPSSI